MCYRNLYSFPTRRSSDLHAGVFYVSTFSATTNKTHVYTTRDIEKGPWQAVTFAPVLHDHSLFFDDDGRVYMIHGVDDRSEEHTSELQSQSNLVCSHLLEK